MKPQILYIFFISFGLVFVNELQAMEEHRVWCPIILEEGTPQCSIKATKKTDSTFNYTFTKNEDPFLADLFFDLKNENLEKIKALKEEEKILFISKGKTIWLVIDDNVTKYNPVLKRFTLTKEELKNRPRLYRNTNIAIELSSHLNKNQINFLCPELLKEEIQECNPIQDNDEVTIDTLSPSLSYRIMYFSACFALLSCCLLLTRYCYARLIEKVKI